MPQQLTHLKDAVNNIFTQVNQLLTHLTDEQYCKPSVNLFNATIGEHVRHIIELFIELDKGYESGVVNYEKRKRDYRIETDRLFAASVVYEILDTVRCKDKMLILEAGFDDTVEDILQIQTNYFRELAYNIEHTIHHMALIRIGVNELSALKVDDKFGIASATIKYRKACVQ